MLDLDGMKLLNLFRLPLFWLAYCTFFTMITGRGYTTLSTALLSLAIVINNFGFICYATAMLPFITDQIIGATSEELSAVVRWNYWAENLGIGLSDVVTVFCRRNRLKNLYISSTLLFAVPLAVIIISDCLCQQWLDRAHKVTNPIKLIIQVLNYTRKHSYPEKRSAFTYIDEEQPTRMDYGKEKFGGPFTEEEVEDVKTVLRLLPLVICLSLSVSVLEVSPRVYLFTDDYESFALNRAITNWLFPVLLIPLYQLLLCRFFQSCNLSMLLCVGVGLFVCTIGRILLSASGVIGVIVSDDVQRYLSCTGLAHHAKYPGNELEWYWKLDPIILYGFGKTVSTVLLYELIIAQSPDKMKGLVMGMLLAFRGLVYLVSIWFSQLTFTLCYDLLMSLILVVYCL